VRREKKPTNILPRTLSAPRPILPRTRSRTNTVPRRARRRLALRLGRRRPALPARSVGQLQRLLQLEVLLRQLEKPAFWDPFVPSVREKNGVKNKVQSQFPMSLD